jgi:hypothetical protein
MSLDTPLVVEKEPRGVTSGSSTPADQDQQPTSYLLLCPANQRAETRHLRDNGFKTLVGGTYSSVPGRYGLD